MGLMKKVFRKSVLKTPAYQRQCRNLIRDGSFIDASKHRKYDLDQNGGCKLCGQADSIEHRCRWCPALHEVYQRHANLLQQWESLPSVTKHHMIPVRNPWLAKCRDLLYNSEAEDIFPNVKFAGEGNLGIFTDGSCHYAKVPEYALGAWAAICATHNVTMSLLQMFCMDQIRR